MDNSCIVELTFEQLNVILTALKMETIRAQENGNEKTVEMLSSAENAVLNYKWKM